MSPSLCDIARYIGLSYGVMLDRTLKGLGGNDKEGIGGKERNGKGRKNK